MNDHLLRRCCELAILGSAKVSPNPMVGALLWDSGNIIGEGWHQAYGSAHAEINALSSVLVEQEHRKSSAEMYVSLEPCSIHGKTPPCTSAIIENQIPRIYIGARDRTPGVDQVSENILRAGKVQVHYSKEDFLCEYLVKKRNTFIKHRRPYIILKWAQSSDGFIGKHDERIVLSNSYTKRYVHKLRAQVDGIVIGANTAKVDDPALTTRYYPGKDPVRIVIGGDPNRIAGLKLADDLSHVRQYVASNDNTFKAKPWVRTFESKSNFLKNVLQDLAKEGIASILVEGGSVTLESFIQANLWDECHLIKTDKIMAEGIAAPHFSSKTPAQQFEMLNDKIEFYLQNAR